MAQVRTGAFCVDGSYSSATGSGACSLEGGVQSWIYQGSAARSHSSTNSGESQIYVQILMYTMDSLQKFVSSINTDPDHVKAIIGVISLIVLLFFFGGAILRILWAILTFIFYFIIAYIAFIIVLVVLNMLYQLIFNFKPQALFTIVPLIVIIAIFSMCGQAICKVMAVVLGIYGVIAIWNVIFPGVSFNVDSLL